MEPFDQPGDQDDALEYADQIRRQEEIRSLHVVLARSYLFYNRFEDRMIDLIPETERRDHVAEEIADIKARIKALPFDLDDAIWDVWREDEASVFVKRLGESEVEFGRRIVAECNGGPVRHEEPTLFDLDGGPDDQFEHYMDTGGLP